MEQEEIKENFNLALRTRFKHVKNPYKDIAAWALTDFIIEYYIKLNIHDVSTRLLLIDNIDSEFRRYWGDRKDVDFEVKMCHYAGFCAGFAGRTEEAKYQNGC